eukprot:Nk52_evm3s2506 gene=Nk52_evmTU3s2506
MGQAQSSKLGCRPITLITSQDPHRASGMTHSPLLPGAPPLPHSTTNDQRQRKEEKGEEMVEEDEEDEEQEEGIATGDRLVLASGQWCGTDALWSHWHGTLRGGGGGGMDARSHPSAGGGRINSSVGKSGGGVGINNNNNRSCSSQRLVSIFIHKKNGQSFPAGKTTARGVGKEEREVALGVEELERQNELCRNCVRRLKVLRYPGIVKYIGDEEDEECIVLVTELVLPLVCVLEGIKRRRKKERGKKSEGGKQGKGDSELGGGIEEDVEDRGRQQHGAMICEKGRVDSLYQVCAGLRNVLGAIEFMGEQCGLVHGNVGLHCVYLCVSAATGEPDSTVLDCWKLFGLEFACPLEMLKEGMRVGMVRHNQGKEEQREGNKGEGGGEPLFSLASRRCEESFCPEDREMNSVSGKEEVMRLLSSRDSWSVGKLVIRLLDCLESAYRKNFAGGYSGGTGSCTHESKFGVQDLLAMKTFANYCSAELNGDTHRRVFSLEKVLGHFFFEENRLMYICDFVERGVFNSTPKMKDDFFEKLPNVLKSLSFKELTDTAIPQLMRTGFLREPKAEIFISCILTSKNEAESNSDGYTLMGQGDVGLLDRRNIEKFVIPYIIRHLVTSRDLHIRLTLLRYIEYFGDMVNWEGTAAIYGVRGGENIGMLRELLTGLQDANLVLRFRTVLALIYLASVLKGSSFAHQGRVYGSLYEYALPLLFQMCDELVDEASYEEMDSDVPVTQHGLPVSDVLDLAFQGFGIVWKSIRNLSKKNSASRRDELLKTRLHVDRIWRRLHSLDIPLLSGKPEKLCQMASREEYEHRRRIISFVGATSGDISTDFIVLFTIPFLTELLVDTDQAIREDAFAKVNNVMKYVKDSAVEFATEKEHRMDDSARLNSNSKLLPRNSQNSTSKGKKLKCIFKDNSPRFQGGGVSRSVSNSTLATNVSVGSYRTESDTVVEEHDMTPSSATSRVTTRESTMYTGQSPKYADNSEMESIHINSVKPIPEVNVVDDSQEVFHSHLHKLEKPGNRILSDTGEGTELPYTDNNRHAASKVDIATPSSVRSSISFTSTIGSLRDDVDGWGEKDFDNGDYDENDVGRAIDGISKEEAESAKREAAQKRLLEKRKREERRIEMKRKQEERKRRMEEKRLARLAAKSDRGTSDAMKSPSSLTENTLQENNSAFMRTFSRQSSDGMASTASSIKDCKKD